VDSIKYFLLFRRPHRRVDLVLENEGKVSLDAIQLSLVKSATLHTCGPKFHEPLKPVTEIAASHYQTALLKFRTRKIVARLLGLPVGIYETPLLELLKCQMTWLMPSFTVFHPLG
jgi:hypothetical protein